MIRLQEILKVFRLLVYRNSGRVARPIILLRIIRLRLLVILDSLMKAIDSSDMCLRVELSPVSITALVPEERLLLALPALVDGRLQTRTAC